MVLNGSTPRQGKHAFKGWNYYGDPFIKVRLHFVSSIKKMIKFWLKKTEKPLKEYFRFTILVNTIIFPSRYIKIVIEVDPWNCKLISELKKI